METGDGLAAKGVDGDVGVGEEGAGVMVLTERAAPLTGDWFAWGLTEEDSVDAGADFSPAPDAFGF